MHRTIFLQPGHEVPARFQVVVGLSGNFGYGVPAWVGSQERDAFGFAQWHHPMMIYVTTPLAWSHDNAYPLDSLSTVNKNPLSLDMSVHMMR